MLSYTFIAECRPEICKERCPYDVDPFHIVQGNCTATFSSFWCDLGDIVDLWLPFTLWEVFVCSMFGCIPSFPSASPTQFKSLSIPLCPCCRHWRLCVLSGMKSRGFSYFWVSTPGRQACLSGCFWMLSSRRCTMPALLTGCNTLCPIYCKRRKTIDVNDVFATFNQLLCKCTLLHTRAIRWLMLKTLYCCEKTCL